VRVPSPSAPGIWGGPDGVFDRLEGEWALERTIESLEASMSGIARFTRLGCGLHYREEGLTRLANGQLFNAHREYCFERQPQGFAVFFAEMPPRLFHRIDITATGAGLRGSGAHLSTPDTYDSTYEFLPDGTFVTRHEVRGPRKAYTSISTFRRVSCPPPSSG